MQLHLLQQLVVSVLAFTFLPHTHYAFKISKIIKHTDTGTSLYSITVLKGYDSGTRQNLLIDLDAPLIWYDCIIQWNIYPGSCPADSICASPVVCDEYQCPRVQSYHVPPCAPVSHNLSIPQTGGWDLCVCPVNVVDPVTGSCVQPLLNYDALSLYSSDGRNVIDSFSIDSINGACAPPSIFQSFPANVSGIMALSSAPYALPSMNNHIFALCLPSSSSAPGVLFVGDGPYYLLPQSNIDLRTLLSYTPLLNQPDSFGYFLSVKAILVNGKPIHLLKQNDSTTKLSTTIPYTILRTDVYNRLVSSFSNATMQIPRVGSVQPFALCFNTSSVGHTRVGLQVPHVAFYLDGGAKWTVFGANSMKQTAKDVTCLAFVDGGTKAEYAIEIGTFQMEDNFLFFRDSKFGFSSSLLRRKTSCANFNFTTV